MRNLDSVTVTEEVLRRIEQTPDARLYRILVSLVRHLHQFAREVDLSEEEWMRGIEYLTGVGQISSPLRQEFVLLSDVLGLSQLVVAHNNHRSKGVTEQTVFGPFHVAGAPLRPNGYDISEGASGIPLDVRTHVVGADGSPVAGARVEVWHADAHGGYDTQDPDWSIEHVRFRGNFVSGSDGALNFRTTMPSSYPIPMDGPVGALMRATNRSPMRPAHLHFRVEHPDFAILVTHVFDASDPFLDSDAVFGVLESTINRFDQSDNGGLRLENRLVLEPLGNVPLAD